MSRLNVHIVSLDIPYPTDYGGVIDIFYEIKSLFEEGAKIHLHCFYKDRKPAEELNKYCEAVYYYKRSKRISTTVPYIVFSRSDEELLKNLSKNNWPIIFNGIHTTYFLYKKLLKGRKVLVRAQNTEFLYYQQLALHESNPLKKIFFKRESLLLNKYERTIANAAHILAIGQTDLDNYQNLFGTTSISLIPAFIPNEKVQILEGTGTYCLYHGNLLVNENEKAVLWLLRNVFNNLDFPFIIAGKNPSKKLQQIIETYSNAKLVSNPSDDALLELIQKAHVNIVPSFNNTGVKLKLLNVLFNGRHCIANIAAVAGIDNSKNTIVIANTAEVYISEIKKLMEIPFTSADIVNRETLLHTQFSNKASAEKIISLIQ